MACRHVTRADYTVAQMSVLCSQHATSAFHQVLSKYVIPAWPRINTSAADVTSNALQLALSLVYSSVTISWPFSAERTLTVSSSVCRLSVAMSHPRQRLELFGNILHRLIAQRLGRFVLNFSAKIRRGSMGSCKLNTMWYKNLAFFDQYLASFRKRYKIRP